MPQGSADEGIGGGSADKAVKEAAETQTNVHTRYVSDSDSDVNLMGFVAREKIEILEIWFTPSVDAVPPE